VINQSGLNGMPVNGFVDVASFKKKHPQGFSSLIGSQLNKGWDVDQLLTSKKFRGISGGHHHF